MIRYSFLVIGAMAGSAVAWAGDLSAPISIENARVLPAGVRNPRFVNIRTSPDSKFNNDGLAEPLGQPLNKSIKWSDVLEGVKGDAMTSLSQKQNEFLGLLQKMRQDYENTLRAAGKSEAEIARDPRYTLTGKAGASVGAAAITADVKLPVLGVGITDRWTLAAAVPIVSMNVYADTGVSARGVRAADGSWNPNLGDEAPAFFEQVCKNDVAACREAADSFNDPVTSKAKRLGYQPVASKAFTALGDVQLISKYLVRDFEFWKLSVRNNFVLPTGRKANPDDLLDVPTGDGRYQVGAGLIFDQLVPSYRDVRFNAFTNYTVLLPADQERRIPKSRDDSLSADKEVLAQNVGGIAILGTAVLHDFPRAGICVGAGYNLSYQTGTTYKHGTRFAEGRYALLDEIKPSQTLHSLIASAGFSTVDWYREKRFALPFQANLTYSHPLAGRNVATADILAGELVLFF
jgi:hypothetical protein